MPMPLYREKVSMGQDESLQHLNRITTCWSLVVRAHRSTASTADAARAAVLERYGGAISRYLLGALRDPDAAEEVAQEFAYCFVRGDFKNADPQRGRFRDLVKTVLFHLIVNYQRERQKRARLRPLPEDSAIEGETPADLPSDREFLDRWRQELLERAWEGLNQEQHQGGPPFYALLRFKAEHPDTTSAVMAERFSTSLGLTLTAAGVRQTLHRARERFAELLRAEVGKSLQTSDPGRIEEELVDLELAPYCRPRVH